MIAKQTTVIAVKFFAMYLLFSLLMTIPSLLAIGSQAARMLWGSVPPNEPVVVLLQILMPLVGIALGGCVIWLIWRLGNSLIAKAPAEAVESAGDLKGDELMRVILSCMGVYLVLMAGIQIIGRFASSRHYADISGDDFQVSLYLLLAPALQLIVGCFLIAKPKQWVRTIRSIGEK